MDKIEVIARPMWVATKRTRFASTWSDAVQQSGAGCTNKSVGDVELDSMYDVEL